MIHSVLPYLNVNYVIFPNIFYFIFVSLLMSQSFASEKNESLPQPYKEPPMDWSKPVVSRGFGDVVADSDSIEDEQNVAQYKSGQVLYFFGNYPKAITKWEPLLAQNFAMAQASMGWLYQMGLGVERNTKKAYELYLAAANQHNAIAENNLGVMYEQGIEVDINLTQARQWYKKSALSGYRFAQYNYANMLLEGLGGEKNREKAINWYKKSAAQEVKQASAKLTSLNVKAE